MTQPSQKKPRCTFTPEFKLDIVRHANTPKASISSIALEHDINANQVFRWIHEVKQNKVRWVLLATRVSNPIALQQALSPTFLPVTVRETQTPDKPLITPNSPLATFEFANGHRLQLHQGNVELLKQLVAVML
jgi:transposase-like protein